MVVSLLFPKVDVVFITLLRLSHEYVKLHRPGLFSAVLACNCDLSLLSPLHTQSLAYMDINIFKKHTCARMCRPLCGPSGIKLAGKLCLQWRTPGSSFDLLVFGTFT